MSLDKFPVFAEYIPPERSELSEITSVTPDWKAQHVRESHYCLQVLNFAVSADCFMRNPTLLTKLRF